MSKGKKKKSPAPARRMLPGDRGIGGDYSSRHEGESPEEPLIDDEGNLTEEGLRVAAKQGFQVTGINGGGFSGNFKG